jgi:Arc/MetJ family transcription regulator
MSYHDDELVAEVKKAFRLDELEDAVNALYI